MDDEQLKEIIIAAIERDNVIKNYLKKNCIKFIKQVDSFREDSMNKRQAETIMKLQDQLKLTTFDLMETREELRQAKLVYKTSRRTILKTREELENIRRNGEINKLGKVIHLLRDMGDEDELN
jgi:hypothetical protein